MREVTERLHQPELISCLKEEKDDRKFWATVDLKALVEWKMKKC
jgi:hypothetical protein